jgi:LacI family transcriptional regulator
MAADHLLEKGFKQFAYCGFDVTPFSRRRCDCFVEYLKSKSYETHIYSCSPKRTDSVWIKEIPGLSDWLKDLPKPIGLLACNDERAMNIVDACFQSNIKVPDEIAMIAVGNDDSICELANPPITSIKTDGEKAGYDAAALLDRMMQGSEKMKSQRIIVEPMYVVNRMSTDVLAVDDPDVAKALNFIRINANKPISVDDVVAIVPLSRRLLEKKFRQILDRSILKEIKKERVKHIARLLIETNLSFSEIAYSVGSSAVENLSRYFTKEMGISPNSYRKQFTKYHRHPNHPLTYYTK